MTKARSRPIFSEDAFEFSGDAIAELREALGDAADSVTRQLHALLSHQRVPRPERFPMVGYPPVMQAKDKSDFRRLIAVLDATIKGIDALSPRMRTRLRQMQEGPFSDPPVKTPGGLEPSAWERLMVIREAAAANVDALARARAGATTRQGRPPDVDRDFLVMDVGMLLHLNGILVTASRSGTFARVVMTVLAEANGLESAPEDLFRLIKEPARMIQEMPPEELRDLLKHRPGITKNADFWSQIMAVQ